MVIGKLYEEQAKLDWQPLYDKLYIYKGITSSLPDILNLQKLAEQKKKDCERNSQVPQIALGDVRKRADVLTYTVFAELNHFQNERDSDLRLSMKNFLQEQLNFYKNIVCKLEDTLQQFDWILFLPKFMFYVKCPSTPNCSSMSINTYLIHYIMLQSLFFNFDSKMG